MLRSFRQAVLAAHFLHRFREAVRVTEEVFEGYYKGC